MSLSTPGRGVSHPRHFAMIVPALLRSRLAFLGGLGVICLVATAPGCRSVAKESSGAEVSAARAGSAEPEPSPTTIADPLATAAAIREIRELLAQERPDLAATRAEEALLT